MTHLEFVQAVTLAFSLVAQGAKVKVEPYIGELPHHITGGGTAAMTIKEGRDKFLVAYDARLLKRRSKKFWTNTAFHEACHAGLDAFGTDKKSILEAEKRARDCASKWTNRSY